MKKLITFKLLVVLFSISVNVNGQSFISVDLNASKLLYDGKRDKIYAIVKSHDKSFANSLVQLNPYSGKIENNVFVGSNPTCMDITKDTNYIYVGLGGATFVKRINLNTFQVDQSIPLGPSTSYAYYAEDVATINTTPDLVVVSLKSTGVSPRHSGVAAYFKGVELPGKTPGHTGSNVIESANDTNYVFGYNNETTEYGLRKMSIDSINGVTLLDVKYNGSLGGDFKFRGQLLFSDQGYVVDPFHNSSMIGRYEFSSWYNSSFEIDVINNKAFYSNIDNGLKIRRYNMQTYAFLDETLLDCAVPDNFQFPGVSDMVRYGSEGLAMVIGENYFQNEDQRVILYESCLVKDYADLSISSFFSKTHVMKNDTLELRICITNQGRLDADSVHIVDTLNSVFTIISTSATSGNIQSTDGIMNWIINTVEPTQKDTAIIKIYVNQEGIFQNTTYITSNTSECNSSNNRFSELINISTTGLTDIKPEKDYTLSFFPNPVTDFLNLTFDSKESDKISLELVNIQGKKLYSETINCIGGKNYKTINFQNLNKGIYLLMFQINDNTIKPIKIIKH